jgi:hypothetical protein
MTKARCKVIAQVADERAKFRPTPSMRASRRLSAESKRRKFRVAREQIRVSSEREEVIDGR